MAEDALLVIRGRPNALTLKLLMPIIAPYG
jgi:hypothetical protein